MVAMQTQACLCVSGEKVSSYWPYLPAGHLPPNWPNPGQGDQAQCVRGNISTGSGSSVPAPHCAKYVTLTSSIIMKLGKSIISFCHIAYPSYKWRYRDSDSFHCFLFLIMFISHLLHLYSVPCGLQCMWLYVGSHQFTLWVILTACMFIPVFLKLPTITDHFIGGRRTHGPPSWKFPHTWKSMQVNRSNISVVKITITTFFLYTNLKYFLK
jgi:hypothetical protein